MDILGNTRNASSEAEIISSEFARIVIGRAVSLCQGFTGTYAQEAQAVFEIGSPELRWISGFANGNGNVDNIVGKNGFFKAFGANSCGRVTAMSLTANQGQNCGSFTSNGQGSLRFKNAVITSYTVTLRAGSALIATAAAFRFAGLEEN